MGLLVGDVIRHAAAVYRGTSPRRYGDGELTFADLDDSSNQVARALAAAGVGHRDRVAWWGETSLEAMPIFGALASSARPSCP